jgi:hypothetical protein
MRRKRRQLIPLQRISDIPITPKQRPENRPPPHPSPAALSCLRVVVWVRTVRWAPLLRSSVRGLTSSQARCSRIASLRSRRCPSCSLVSHVGGSLLERCRPHPGVSPSASSRRRSASESLPRGRSGHVPQPSRLRHVPPWLVPPRKPRPMGLRHGCFPSPSRRRPASHVWSALRAGHRSRQRRPDIAPPPHRIRHVSRPRTDHAPTPHRTVTMTCAQRCEGGTTEHPGRRNECPDLNPPPPSPPAPSDPCSSSRHRTVKRSAYVPRTEAHSFTPTPSRPHAADAPAPTTRSHHTAHRHDSARAAARDRGTRERPQDPQPRLNPRPLHPRDDTSRRPTRIRSPDDAPPTHRHTHRPPHRRR